MKKKVRRGGRGDEKEGIRTMMSTASLRRSSGKSKVFLKFSKAILTPDFEGIN